MTEHHEIDINVFEFISMTIIMNNFNPILINPKNGKYSNHQILENCDEELDAYGLVDKFGDIVENDERFLCHFNTVYNCLMV